MKNLACLILFFTISSISYSQIPFLPVGARWVSYYQCDPGGPPPMYFNYIVTQDSIIQGKYSTLIYDGWPCSNGSTWVHQDGEQIYVYDSEGNKFVMVLDFSKEVGESWQIELCENWFPSDTVTITVLASSGTYRRVLADFDNWHFELDLYEGFGGEWGDNRLLFSWNMFVFADPACWSTLICYEDPTEGILYGSGDSCLYNATKESIPFSNSWINLYPNPVVDEVHLHYEFPGAQDFEWVLYDATGNLILKQKLSALLNQAVVSVKEMPTGLYFWQIQSDGKRFGSGKLLIQK